MDQLKHVLDSFGVTWPTFLASLANFVILLVILQRFAYRPLLQVLDERRRRIAESLKQAEEIKTELAKTQAAREEVLAEGRAAAQRMIDEARQAAERLRDTKLVEATAAAQDLLHKAEQAGRREHDRLMTELRREMVGLVVATTARVTGKILTADDQRRLEAETLKELAA
ncbi:MAG: F0F1 ATP synthase subunit B [Verrucomicrobiae bacterium]|nr:F0F1 ATP synthase subunit B [Verrucomicrobiae bacterium]